MIREEIERLLRAVVSQDIISVVQKESVVDTPDLQTELDRMKERFKNCIIKKGNEYANFWNDWINPFKTSREEKNVSNKVRASTKTKPITVSQPLVMTKKYVNSDSNGLSSTGVDNTKTRRPQPRSNTKNDMVPSVSKSSQSKNKEFKVEDHYRNLLLSMNKKHMSSECNNKQTTNVSIKENQKKRKPKVKKPKKVGFIESLATPKPSKSRSFRRWSPIGRMSDLNGKIIASSKSESQSDCSKGDNACTSNPMEPSIKRFPNATISLAAEAARTMLIFSHAPLFLWTEAIATACFTQNRSIIHRRFNKTPYELINDRNPDISFLHVFGALCYPKNDREDIGKLGAKGDIGFFIGYSADSCAYRIFNQRTKKMMETMNVSFDELLAMAFEQCSSKPGFQSMTSGQISSRLDLTYAPSTITTQQPTEGELDLLFEAMYDDYIGGQPSVTARTVSAAQEPQDHPPEQVIGEPSLPVLTRNQLRSDGDMCMYALTVSTMEPKNVKEAMTDPALIESMQEELLQFKKLDVWVLVPAPDNISPLTLKWLFKNKHDEEQMVIR
nr:retrovirus-related Pol polyprotein from transposon TNT 1-94 [Tanacetum cinerariifolium]